MELSKEQKDAFTPGLHAARLKHIRASYEAAKKGHAFIGIPSHDEQIAIIDALLAAEEQQPVAWTDAEELRDLARVGFAEMFSVEPVSVDADPLRVIPLYLHPQQGKAVQVPDEADPRDAFENVFPIPAHVSRCGKGYAVHEFNAWSAHDYVKTWDGWNACHVAMLHGSETVQDLPENAGSAGECRSSEKEQVPDEDLTDDVLDEIIAEAKTSMEQYLALSLKAERAAMLTSEPVSSGDGLNSPVIPEGWVACGERMPEAGGDMIVFADGIIMSGISYNKKKGFYIQALEYDDDETVDSVTHWMPLPAAPKPEVK